MKRASNLTDTLINTLLKLFTLLAFGFVFLPIIVLVVFSFNADRIATLPWRGTSLVWYGSLLEDERIVESALNTLGVGVCVSVLATILGVTAAYCLYRWDFPGKKLYYILTAAPPCSPLLVLAVALLAFLQMLGLGNSLSSVVIGHTVLCAPFALALASLRLAQMDRALEEASWNLGCNEWQTLIRVVLPQMVPTIAACLALTLALSSDEFIVSWFVSGLDTTLPVRIYTMMSGALSPKINAIGTIVFVVSQLLVIGAAVLFTRSMSSRNRRA
jgi:spermidine/putrescine transport system permease protein